MSSRGEPKERGFFRSIVSSIGSSSGSLRGTQSSTSTSSTGSSPVHESSRSLGKNHSFSGNLSFSRSSEDHANGTSACLCMCVCVCSDSCGCCWCRLWLVGAHQSILSKRPSLILPFHNNASNSSSSSNNQSSHHHHHNGHDDSCQRYLEDFQAPIAKSGVLIKQANHFKTWKKRLMVLKGHSLFYYVSGTVRRAHTLVLSSCIDTFVLTSRSLACDAVGRRHVPARRDPTLGTNVLCPLILGLGVLLMLCLLQTHVCLCGCKRQGVKITPIDSVRFKRQNCFEICHPVRCRRPSHLWSLLSMMA